jgi:hypothetical protein
MMAVSSQAGGADRVPSLDGIRACGVSLLLCNHVSNHLVPDLPVVIGASSPCTTATCSRPSRSR